MKKLAKKRILLIGGAGFIGHHLALRLKRAGAEVFVVDSLSVNNYHSFLSIREKNPEEKLYLKIIQDRLGLLELNDIPVIVTDARDYAALSKIASGTEPDILIHLAAVAHAGKSNKDPYSTFDHSLRTLENALDCRRKKLKHFIYFSSSMVYGNFDGEFVTEESPCEPLGIYGALKFAGEKIVIAYNQVFDLPYTIIRPSALYGPRCVSRRVGQIFIEKAISGDEIHIEGDGRDKLDFTYIDDLISGVMNVLTNDKSKNQIFNLTFGQSRTINEMAAILTDHLPNIVIEYVTRDRLLPKRGTLSIAKAQQMIGYNPMYSLEEGFAKYIKWYKDLFSKDRKYLKADKHADYILKKWQVEKDLLTGSGLQRI
jgi:nucleoside-diphosphate-sugar epimerase